MEIIIELLESFGPETAFVGLLIYGAFNLVKWLNNKIQTHADDLKALNEEYRQELDEVHGIYREELKDIIAKSEEERQHFIDVMQKISSDTNESIKNLTLTVIELKTIVESKIK